MGRGEDEGACEPIKAICLRKYCHQSAPANVGPVWIKHSQRTCRKSPHQFMRNLKAVGCRNVGQGFASKPSLSIINSWVGWCLQLEIVNMGVRLSVEDVVGVVAKTLASIDVRTASVFIDSKWQNVMTVVRLLPDSPNIVSDRVLDTFRKYGSIRGREFRIDQKVIGFQEWSVLLAEFTKGQLEFPEGIVEFGGPVGVGGSMGYVQNRHYSLWPLPEWPVLEASISTVSPTDASKTPQYRINGESIQRAVSRAGYSGVMDAITALLGIKVSQGFSGFDVFIAVPIMARITDAVFHPGDMEFDILHQS